jgi:hypothetical protein
MHLVKTTFAAISSPLIHIFNKSIEQGIVPNQFKTAKVVPVFKSEPTSRDNFRSGFGSELALDRGFL